MSVGRANYMVCHSLLLTAGLRGEVSDLPRPILRRGGFMEVGLACALESFCDT